jgi:hypothetical protein
MSGVPILVAVVALGTSVLVPAVYSSSVERSGNEAQVATVAENTTVNCTAAVSSMLDEARAKIKGADTREYYDELVAAYELDEPSSLTVETENSNVQEIVPDIEKIQQKALTMPLQEAGKQIKDKELADFYYRFLEDSGWTIKPGK